METTAAHGFSAWDEKSRLATHAFVRVSHAHTTPSSSPLSNRLSSSLTANAVTRPACPPKKATGATRSPRSASPGFVSQRTMLPSTPPVHLVVVTAPSAATAHASANAVARWRGGTDGHAPAATSSGRMSMCWKLFVFSFLVFAEEGETKIAFRRKRTNP
jgi:hypothetical protein